MSQSLYLKYRPKSFDDVVWQHHVVDILKAQLTQQEFNSSYLLYGPRGTWKTSTARLLAKAVNADNDITRWIDRTNDPAISIINTWETLDVVEIDAASHTGVDNIREEIIDKAIYPPTTLRKKVYIIDEVHMLSKGAFNALLKIMEEPRDYLIFILATTEIHKVPDTIISRCQTFTFRNLTIEKIVWRLMSIAEKEWIEYEKEWLELIAKLSNWGLRDAIKYLEQISILWTITVENVSKFLWVVSWAVIETLMQAIATKDYSLFEKTLNDLVERGTDLQALVKDIFRRIDDHFSENPALRSPRVSIFKEISSEMRRYPSPELIRKKKVWMRVSWIEWWVIPVQQQHQISSSQKLDQGNAKSIKLSNDVLPTEEESDNSKNIIQEENKDSIISQETSEHSFEWSHEELLKKLTERVDKKMIQWILSKQTSVDSYQDWQLKLIVINRLYASTLSKEDTIRLLEDALHDITWQAIQISVQYMSKEDFMKKQLGE